MQAMDELRGRVANSFKKADLACHVMSKEFRLMLADAAIREVLAWQREQATRAGAQENET